MYYAYDSYEEYLLRNDQVSSTAARSRLRQAEILALASPVRPGHFERLFFGRVS